MPGGDRTGPMGMGSRTGRGAGFCSGAGVPGYANSEFGRGGFGFRRGGGRGFFGAGRGMGGRFFGPVGYGTRAYGYAPAIYPSAYAGPADEKQALKAEADALNGRIDEINRRMDTLTAKRESGE